MCGRYRRTTSEEELAKRYHIPIPRQTDLPISWNVAPSQNVLAIRKNPETGERSLDALKWGLVPSWAKDEKIAYKTINARVETVDTSASYRAAFKKRRCLIPADSFYEWKKAGTVKQPYAIGLESGEPFVFAGLWEGWPRPGTDEWLRTCTIITCEPNEFVATIHNRMPVILPEMHHEAWLSGEAGKHNLTPYPAEEMIAWPIDSRVNSPRNNDPAIVEPFG
jgi:putative SOS response-associated peptidase YedK